MAEDQQLAAAPSDAEGERRVDTSVGEADCVLQNCRNEARPAQARFSAQRPRVKSGNSTGALPRATDSSLRAAGALHAAAS